MQTTQSRQMIGYMESNEEAELVKCTDKEGLNIATSQFRGISNSW